MRAAIKLLVIAGVAAAGSGCHKQQAQQPRQTSAKDNGADQNADIETLPPDESSGTSSKELMNGSDNPDVNAIQANSD